MGKAIGIDLGTTNSVVAYKDTTVRVIQTGPNPADLRRSCVTLGSNNQFLVGNEVYNNWSRLTPNIVVSVKRLMGTGIQDSQVQKMCKDKNAYPYGIQKPTGGTEDAVAVILRGREFSPEQISGEILKALKNDANKMLGNVTHAVITVPAYFTEKQKSATKYAAELAGLRVQRLLAEPTAAAISFGFDKIKPGDDPKTLLVYDFGGGTFDLSVLIATSDQFIEAGSGGDRWLGGDDIDRILSEYVCKQIEKRDGFVLSELLAKKSEKELKEFNGGLKHYVEEAKKALSTYGSATIYFSYFLENEEFDPVKDLDVTRGELETLIKPLIQRTIDLIEELLQKTGIPMNEINNILLVGGSSNIPLVKKMLSDKYGADKVLSSEKAMLSIAEGAAILAQSLPSEDSEIGDPPDEPDEVVIVATKHQTFIQLENMDGSRRMEKIIDSQEVLPTVAHRRFKTLSNNQKIVEVKLFTDAENGSFDKLSTGFFTISENLPALSELDFTFSLDKDETMSAKVKVVKTGKITEIRLGRGKNDSSCLSELSDKLVEILHNPHVSDSKKATFISEIQQVIDQINQNNYSPTDSRWANQEESIRAAYTRALMGEKYEDKKGEILAMILLSEFEQFLNQKDAKEMKENLNKLKCSHDNFEKDSLREKLEVIANGYIVLLHIYMFKLVGENSQNPMTAGKAICIYEELLDALKNHNIVEVNELLRSNQNLLREVQEGKITIGDTTIGA